MSARNDTSTIDQLAHTIAACVRHEVPDRVIHTKLEEITKAAEARGHAPTAGRARKHKTGGRMIELAAAAVLIFVAWTLDRIAASMGMPGLRKKTQQFICLKPVANM